MTQLYCPFCDALVFVAEPMPLHVLLRNDRLLEWQAGALERDGHLARHAEAMCASST